MRKILAAQLIVLSLIFHIALGHAQGLMTLGAGSVKATAASGGGYTGPGNVIAFGFWVGLRAYSTATLGNALISLCDNTGANCANVSSNATTGVLNAPGTRGAVNCNTSPTCLIAEFYDQAGSGLHCLQATAANMAVLNMTGGPSGTTPAALFVRANSVTYTCGSSGGVTNPVQPFTQISVAERTGTTGSFNTVIGSGGPDLLFNASANSCGGYAGSVLADSTHCADSSWHLIQVMYNNASSKVQLGNNTPVTGTVGTAVGTSDLVLGNGVGGLLDGRLAEVGAVDSDQSANFSSYYTNANGFWGGL